MEIETSFMNLWCNSDRQGIGLALCLIDGQGITYIDTTFRNQIGLVEFDGDEAWLGRCYGLDSQVGSILVVLDTQL